MAFQLKNADGSLRAATAIRIKNADGSLRYATKVQKKLANGTLATVWTAFYLSSSTASGYAMGSGLSGPVTSNAITVYGSTNVSWVQLNGGAMTISNPGGTYVTWTATVNNGVPRTAAWRCTDNNTGAIADVTVTLNRDSNA